MADAIVGVYRLDGRTVGELQLRAMVDSMAYPRAAPITLWARGPVGFAAVGVVKREAVEERSNGVHVLHLGNAIVVNAHDDTLLDLLASDPSLQNLDRLSGAFCGGLWDDENRRLVCFRDHLGVNPLYYRYRVNDYFIFASTISALLAYMENEERVAVDEERLGDFLLHLPPSIGSTFFRDIRRVPPAHKLVVGASGLQLQRFWRPELSEHPPTSDADFAAAFKVLFEGAVRRSYANSSSLGTMLSGGMDSSSIACVASDLLSGSDLAPLHSFTYLYGANPSDDERDYAKAVIDAKKLSPHFIRTDQGALFDDADRLLRVAEEPYEHPGYATAWPLSVAVRDAGISTLLDGTLGDSVLSYDTWFIESLMRRGQLMTAVRETVLFVRRQDEWASPFPLLWNDGLIPNP
jgi:asparagine synthase (glutamine-hydrolysing)